MSQKVMKRTSGLVDYKELEINDSKIVARENLSGYFKYSDLVRKLIYTTNPIAQANQEIHQNKGCIYQHKCLV